jgi:sulfur carrier protein
VTAIVLNGEPHDLPDGATVADAVVAAGAPADGRGVAAAIDGEVVPRGSWPATALAAGQHVEVLHAVQGG